MPYQSSCLHYPYSYLQQFFEPLGIRAINITPSYHFFFYLESFKSILVGLGLISIARFLSNKRKLARNETTMLIILLAVCVVLAYPFYLRRDFFRARADSLSAAEQTDSLAAFEWIQENTQPTDVFLASDSPGLFVVGQSGRKVVSINPYFSNPYVNWEVREEDRMALFDYLHAADGEGFSALATTYSVKYILVDAAGETGDMDEISFLTRTFNSGSISIYRIVNQE